MSKFFGKSSSELAKSKYDLVKDTYSTSSENQITLSPLFSQTLRNDPKWIGFTFARHKFISKMFNQMDRLLEVGCWEGVASLLIAKSCNQLVVIDYYKPHVEWANKNIAPIASNIKFLGHDILDAPIEIGTFDGAFSLDILEHIDPEQEKLYMSNICKCLNDDGAFILGTPSLEAQQYAGLGSKLTHINCKTSEQLKELSLRFYKNVFMFGMNDEVLHTGFSPMCQYLFALCTGPKVR